MKVVRVSWLNPARRIDQHPEAVEGIKIEQQIDRPSHQDFMVASAEDAAKLKAQLEARVPRNSYTVVGEDNRPLMRDGQPVVFTEPKIEIIDLP